MTSTTIVKCTSHQAEIQIETWQSHSSSNVPNNVTNIQSHVTNSNELTCILIFHTQANLHSTTLSNTHNNKLSQSH